MTVDEFVKQYGTDRKGTDCLKWDALEERYGDPNLIAMWVADMEFRTPDAVLEAMHTRVDHGVFGYSILPDEYYNAVINWQKKRHGNILQKEWFRFSTGVVGALYSFVNAYTNPKDAVMIITPVYYPFHNAVKDTGRTLVLHCLENNHGIYTLNFEKFEKDLQENNVKMLIHSSPHNPVGKVWTEQELDTLFTICKRNNVLVISDEIHQDIILGDKKQIPAFAVANGAHTDHVISVTAASKTFNLAGLIHSHIFIANETLRKAYDDYIKTVGHAETNIMGCTATRAAYEYGEDWLEGLLNVIRANKEYAEKEFATHLPKAIVSPLEGTYLLWVDMREYLGTENVKEFIQDKCNIAVDFGEWFCPNCKGFIRFNLATDPKYVKQAMQNIISNLT